MIKIWGFVLSYATTLINLLTRDFAVMEIDLGVRFPKF